MNQRNFNSRSFGGLPLDKKIAEDRFVERLSGIDLRTPSQKSVHEEHVWFHKIFLRKSKK